MKPAHLQYIFSFVICITICSIISTSTSAQKVGIGTSSPQKLFSVNGTIMLDQGNKNSGSLDSAALVFGSAAQVGIFSRKTIGDNKDGFDFVTNGITRMTIGSGGTVGINGNANVGGILNVTGATVIDDNFRVNGRAGIGGATDGNYQLIVHGGNSYFDGNTSTTGNSDVTGALNVGGVGIVGDNFRVNGRVGIGGATNASYQLIVNNGNSYFDGNISTNANATVTGTVNANGNLTIKGNGHVRSNGSSNLKVGFDQVSFDVFVPAHDFVDVTANITAFTGGNADIRVYPCQVATSVSASTAWEDLRYIPFAVNATNNTCKIRIQNLSGSGNVAVGTLYLMSVAKE